MNYLKSYKLFLEARLSDVLKLKIKNTSDFSKELEKSADKDFTIERDLVKYVTLNKRIGNKKIRFKLNYYDTIIHSIKNRIKNRTSLKSIEEFNDIIESGLNQIFPNELGINIVSSGKYSLVFVEYNFSVIFTFDLNQYLNKEYELDIITLISGVNPLKTIYDFVIE